MKKLDIKTDIRFFVYAALLCLFWYLIFIWANQPLALLFSAVTALLAVANLYLLMVHTFQYMKGKLYLIYQSTFLLWLPTSASQGFQRVEKQTQGKLFIWARG